MANDRKQDTTEKRTTQPSGRTVAKPRERVQPLPPSGGGRNRRLEERTVAELRERAKALEISGRSKMNKEELVRAIRRKNG